MNNNLTSTVIAAIAETQDGRLTGNGDDYNDFITSRIFANTYGEDEDEISVDVPELLSNFKYMINELKKACEPLERFVEQHL